MANSWILGASLFGMRISLAGPRRHAPGPKIQALLKAEGRALDYEFTTDPREAVKGADLVYTDVWTSMGQEAVAKQRVAAMRRYAVTAKLFAAAKPDALFMHCLPAHPGEEVAQEVLDNPRCLIFDEAENRLHVQKAILTLLAQSARK
jgi:ornithine carbamoyltransferase